MTASAPALSPGVLSALEDAAGDFDSLGAVIRAITEALGPDGGAEAHRLLCAATFMHDAIDAKFVAVIDQAYAERRVAEAA